MEDAVRLTPCKDDKLKDAEIMLFQADSDYYLSAMPPADLIARAKFSSHTRRNAHGHNNLLSFLALPIRDS